MAQGFGRSEIVVAKRFGGGKVTRGVEISASGDNTVHTPAAGKFLRVYWVALNAPETGSEVLAIVKFGGVVHYRWYMGAPAAFMHWETIEGVVDEPLVVNLSGARTVQVNYTLEEI